MDSFTPEEIAALEQLQLSPKDGTNSNPQSPTSKLRHSQIISPPSPPLKLNGNKENVEKQNADGQPLEEKANGPA